MIYVIGSGPSGVACASALLSRGLSVTMLDTGVELESEKNEILSQLQNEWDETKLDQLKQIINSHNPIKLSFNSNYPYTEVNNHYSIVCDSKVDCIPSFSKGGLSNVWGAFYETYSSEYFNGWPVKLHEIAPYYNAIEKLVPRSISTPSEQAKFLFGHFDRHSANLSDNGIDYALSNLAVNFNSGNIILCKYCGNCQHGCPLDLIYSARHTLSSLLSNRKFTYIKNIVVDSFRETENDTTIYAHHLVTNKKIEFKGKYIFSGCGPVISTAIVMRALNLSDRSVVFKDSSHFMLPILMRNRIKNVASEKLHTLCQLQLKLLKPSITANKVNLQLYTYMDHYDRRLKQIFRVAYPYLSPLLSNFMDRLMVIQGHLHSDDSHQFEMRLVNDELSVKSIMNNDVSTKIKKISGYLSQNKKYLGFSPLAILLKESKIARSFHYGCSMPMSANPHQHQSDILGRPFGLKRWHVIDASVFPTMPAGSCTPTIMANAYRIGMECDIDEKI